ncbi:GntR family transcriptional regulator [Caulobacter sp. LARHSG274]
MVGQRSWRDRNDSQIRRLDTGQVEGALVQSSLVSTRRGSRRVTTYIGLTPDTDPCKIAPLDSAGRSWTLPGGAAPRYRQLYNLIRDRLASGELRIGDRLPDERHLARLCGVSRLTVRGALALLEAERRIQRRTRVGTIICEQQQG